MWANTKWTKVPETFCKIQFTLNESDYISRRSNFLHLVSIYDVMNLIVNMRTLWSHSTGNNSSVNNPEFFRSDLKKYELAWEFSVLPKESWFMSKFSHRSLETTERKIFLSVFIIMIYIIFNCLVDLQGKNYGLDLPKSAWSISHLKKQEL